MVDKKRHTVDEYISSLPIDVKDIMEKLRKVIKTSAPEAQETINYGIPTFILNGKNLVHFAASKKHISFYPTPSTIEAFKEELTGYDISKGTVKFPINKIIPLELVIKMVKYRVSEVVNN